MLRASLKNSTYHPPDLPFYFDLILLFGKGVACLMQGGVIVILCTVALFMKENWLRSLYFPLSFVPHILMPYLTSLFISFAVGMTFLPVLSRWLLSHFSSDKVEPEHLAPHEMNYLLTSWVMPLVLFALNIALNVSIGQALWLGFGLASVNSILTLIVEPKIRGLLNSSLLNAVAPTSSDNKFKLIAREAPQADLPKEASIPLIPVDLADTDVSLPELNPAPEPQPIAPLHSLSQQRSRSPTPIPEPAQPQDENTVKIGLWGL